MLAKMKKPRGMPTPMPIFVGVGRPEEAAEGFELGSELCVVDLVFKEAFAAGCEAADLEAVRFSEAILSAVVELGVVVVEIARDVVRIDVANAVEVIVGLATIVPSAI